MIAAQPSAGPDPSTAFRTAEFEFVVACVAWPRSPERLSSVVNLAGRVEDWRRVVALIDRHRVASLAFNAFTEAPVVTPADVHAALASRARDEAVQELRAAYETRRLVHLIKAADVDVIVVKGVTTALAAFGKLGLRHSMDIDLLVVPRAVPAASAALRGAGYVRTEPPENANASTMDARLKRYKDIVFTHSGTGVIVELHWRLFQNPTLFNPVEGHGITIIPGAGAVPTLDPRVALLYLCLHGAEHAWARLKWLADLAAILGSNADLAAGLYAQGRTRGLQRLIGPGLVLSHQLFATPLPDQLRCDLARDWRMRWLVRSNREALFGDEDGLELEEQSLATTRKNLGHYVASDSPAYWYKEFVYDLLDGAAGGNVVGRAWKLLSKVTSSLTIGRSKHENRSLL